jgi:phosphoglycerate dehydrogenase-like enzyme
MAGSDHKGEARSGNSVRPNKQQQQQQPSAAWGPADDGGMMNNLVWLQSTFAGVDALFSDKFAARRNYLLTAVGDGFGPQISEYVAHWILHFHLQAPLAAEQQQQRRWLAEPFKASRVALSESGKTVLILGSGRIGSHLARALGTQGLGLRTLGLCSLASRPAAGRSDEKKGNEEETKAREGINRAYAQTQTQTQTQAVKDDILHLQRLYPAFDEVSSCLPELLAQADIVVNCLPSTKHTHHLLTLPLILKVRGPDPCPSHPVPFRSISPVQKKHS